MNQVKFRVWNKVLGQYIDKNYHKEYYLNFDGVLCTFNDFGLVLPLDMKNYIIELYTGLEDVDGTGIYAGDRCTYEYKDFIIKDGGDTGNLELDWLLNEGIVTWYDGAFRFELLNGLWIVLFQNRELKIIGTIHDKK